jgi:uncharacterized membrane protein
MGAGVAPTNAAPLRDEAAAGGEAQRRIGRMLYRRVALLFVSALFLSSGMAHHVATDTFVSIMPAYIPCPREVVVITGLCEIAGAVGLWFRRTRRSAGYALALFTLAVLPVHIDMLVHAADWPRIGAPLLWLRLAMQPALAAIILYAIAGRDLAASSVLDSLPSPIKRLS